MGGGALNRPNNFTKTHRASVRVTANIRTQNSQERLSNESKDRLSLAAHLLL